MYIIFPSLMYFSFSFFTWFWDYLWVHQACFSFRKWKWIYSLNGNRLPKPVQEHRMHANVQNIISPYVFPHDYDLVQLFFIYLASSLLHQWLHLPKQESKKLSKQNMLKQIHPTVRICRTSLFPHGHTSAHSLPCCVHRKKC